ncbi:hypothetical protein [Niveispirillum sp. KHB5.9]|uniref:hypothetical protein n=1 Tax=Niveispirillum sp. KHB5.9 TaxID=3400269 RepID=UPI003A83ECFB
MELIGIWFGGDCRRAAHMRREAKPRMRCRRLKTRLLTTARQLDAEAMDAKTLIDKLILSL